MKDAKKQEIARKVRREIVRIRVTVSHVPLLVKIGVRSWKVRSVPVGRRFAKWAVLARANDAAERRGGDEVGVISAGGR